MLRATAVLLVVVAHACNWNAGAFGVDLFFVISGFIMAKIAHRRTAKAFLLARFKRIWPSYILAAAPFILVAMNRADWSISRALTDFTLWPLWFQLERPTLSQGWTLSFELLFYIGVAATLLIRSPVVVLAAYACAFTAAAFVEAPLVQFAGSPLFLEFIAGVAIAHMRTSERAGQMAAIAGCALFLIVPVPLVPNYMSVFVFDETMLRVGSWGPCAVLIAYGFIANERLLSGQFPALVFIGNASYSIYLWHSLPHQISLSYAPNPAALSVFLVLFGCAMYKLIEVPLTSGPRRRTPRHEVHGSTAGA